MALYTVATNTQLAALDLNQLYNLLTGVDTSTQLTVAGRIQALTDSTPAPSGYVGGVNGAAPTTGSFLAGDFVVDQTGTMWVCAVSGSPGTWYRQAGANYGCVAVQTAAQSLSSHSGGTGFDAWNLNALQDPNSDPHGMFSSSAHTVTVPLAGYYAVSGVAGTTGGSGTWDQAAIILHNGTAVSRGGEWTVSSGGDCSVTDLVQCAAGDTFRLASYQETACSVNTSAGHAVLSAMLIA